MMQTIAKEKMSNHTQQEFTKMGNTKKTMISFSGVSVAHGDNTVLQDVSVNITQGEFVYVVGKSGAGKSSFLKVVYGEQKPQSGSVIVMDTDVCKLTWKTIPKFRRKMGIISNEYPLLFHLNVYENLALVLRATTSIHRKKDIVTRVTQVLQSVSLASKVNAMPFELSTGEKQRVQVARALLNSASLIIADEPTANLDPETSLEVIDLLHVICRKFNITFLVSTNDHSIIRQYPARILHIRNNRLNDFASLQNIQM